MPAEVLPQFDREQLHRAYLDETDPGAREMLFRQLMYELNNSRIGAATGRSP